MKRTQSSQSTKDRILFTIPTDSSTFLSSVYLLIICIFFLFDCAWLPLMRFVTIPTTNISGGTCEWMRKQVSEQGSKWKITLVTIAANSISSQEKLPLVEAGLPCNEFRTLFHSDGVSLPNAPCNCSVSLARPPWLPCLSWWRGLLCTSQGLDLLHQVKHMNKSWL